MSLEQLDVWLQTLEPPPRVDGASMLDGYLTAIVIGPCSIPPDEWFVHLLGERGRIATASGATMTAITTIVSRFNAIGEGLSLAPNKHAPLFEKTGDGLALPHPWCMGFLSAMRLRFDEWGSLLDLNRIDHGLLLPILLYCTDPLGRPCSDPARGTRNRTVPARNLPGHSAGDPRNPGLLDAAASQAGRPSTLMLGASLAPVTAEVLGLARDLARVWQAATAEERKTILLLVVREVQRRGTTVTVKLAHLRLCHGRMLFVRAWVSLLADGGSYFKYYGVKVEVRDIQQFCERNCWSETLQLGLELI